MKKGSLNEKFCRIISPVAFLFAFVLDVAVVIYAVFAVKKLAAGANVYSVIFAAMDLLAIAVGILVTKEVLTQGVRFGEESLEFTVLDDNNVFKYAEIEKLESEKDTKASFKKNFNDRQSHIVFYLKNDKIVTVDLGLTTKRTLQKITDEINSRICIIGDEAGD